MSKPIRTFIYGSCVSRDTIAAARPGEFEIVGYVARQSLISMARNAFDSWPEGFRLESNFQQRVVQGDWLGNAWWVIPNNKDIIDLLLLDLTDERFGVYKRDESSIITRSIDMMGTDLEHVAKNFELLPFGSDKHLDLFEESVTKFSLLLKLLGLFEKTRVLRVPWASTTENRQPTPASLDLTAEHANEIFPRYFAVLEKLGFQFIDVPIDQLHAYSSHQWGVAAFHYTPAVYESILEQLRGEHPAEVETSVASNEDEKPQALRKDYARISAMHTQWSSVDEFLTADLHVNGVHTIQVGESTVEFYLQGQPLQNEQTMIPVFFSGAVTDRATKQPPFFSGYGISQAIGTPFIALSDPLVDAHADVNIAWYAGSMGSDLQGELARFFTGIHERFGKELLMVGGSAGGFAALQYAHRVGRGASAFVWNPQTDITQYYESFAKRFLKVAGVSEDILATTDWKDHAKEALRGRLNLELPSPDELLAMNKLLIIQNESDWHLKTHLMPWLNPSGWPREEQQGATFYVADEDHLVAVGDFAEGHSPLPPVVIKMVLSSLLSSQSTVKDTVM
ncbi:DUF6270 domain-containing protein [Rothia sp. LK2588]|uniref:DUF6270 domain-containing protein n=1 Tax=Rothia sp. LK2588 TaxID=3114369 RepID=UPI0034CFD2FA